MKTTIKSLQQKLAQQQADVAYWKKEHDAECDRRRKAECARDEMEKARDRAEEERNRAQRDLHTHRDAVLEYFMVLSNPEAAKDIKRVQALQAKIAGMPMYYRPAEECANMLRPMNRLP